MRPSVSAAVDRQDWRLVLSMKNDLLTADEPDELRVLGLAFFYGGQPFEALRLFRIVRSRLTGWQYAATLIDGACALSLTCQYAEALLWLSRYFEQEHRSFDGPAYECQAFCLWKQHAPLDLVDGAYQQATIAFGQQSGRSARMTVDRIQMLIEYGNTVQAAVLIDTIQGRAELLGKVLSCQARLAEATGDHRLAYEIARDALSVLKESVDQFGSILREIFGVQLLLGRVSLGAERLVWAEAARASAVILQDVGLKRKAEVLIREVSTCAGV